MRDPILGSVQRPGDVVTSAIDPRIEDRWPLAQAEWTCSQIAAVTERMRLVYDSRHFPYRDPDLPPGLLASQFKTLEPPERDENPVTVSIDAPVDAVVDDIIHQLGLVPLNSDGADRNPS